MQRARPSPRAIAAKTETFLDSLGVNVQLNAC